MRAGLASRFAGLPDAHYGEGRHWVSGDLGVSEWLLTGTRSDGEQVRVRGCDHWEFRGARVVRKDSYWKIVDALSPGVTEFIEAKVSIAVDGELIGDWSARLTDASEVMLVPHIAGG